ncbi:MAG: uroporphyrinogen decarboxylase family protein, partial [Anaerolineae bacterium]|nr:uroporphyrinogen decarboxylase family protein [Anaerolineae bacterium]
MSRSLALQAINLESTDRIPNWEFLSNPDFECALTGIDPYTHPQKSALRMVEILDLDIASVPLSDDALPPLPEDGVDAEGHRIGRWGGGTTWRWDWGAKFKTEADVLIYQPLMHMDMRESSMPVARDYRRSVAELADEFANELKRSQDLLGDNALSGVPGFYNTFFMWPLLTFGWDLFITTAMQYPAEMARLMDDFGQISQKAFSAWAEVQPTLFVSHDDICYTRGPVFNPKWLRRYVYPWYERLWDILHKRDVKVLFMSDGNVDDVVDDIFACGADGIMGEPYTNLEAVVQRYPEKILLGNADNRILMSGE